MQCKKKNALALILLLKKCFSLHISIHVDMGVYEYINVYRLALFSSIVSAMNRLNPEYSYKNGFPFKDPTKKGLLFDPF